MAEVIVGLCAFVAVVSAGAWLITWLSWGSSGITWTIGVVFTAAMVCLLLALFLVPA